MCKRELDVLDVLCPDSQYMIDLSEALNDKLKRMMNRQELNFKENHK